MHRLDTVPDKLNPLHQPLLLLVEYPVINILCPISFYRRLEEDVEKLTERENHI